MVIYHGTTVYPNMYFCAGINENESYMSVMTPIIWNFDFF